MRRRIPAVIVCLGLIALAGWAYQRHSPAAAHAAALTVVPEFVDVKRSDSDTAFATVELRNTGTDPIHIDKLETSCHCTTVDSIPQMDLAPGASVAVKLKLQLPSFGKQETSVTVFTDSGEKPTLRIPVKMAGGDIHPPYFLTNTHEVRHVITGPDDRRVEFEVSAVESPGDPWMTGFESSNAALSVVSCESEITTKYDDTSWHRTYHCVLEVSRYVAGETLRGSIRPQCRSESKKPMPLIPVAISSEAIAKAIPSQLFVTEKSRKTAPVIKTVVIKTAENISNPIQEVSASVNWIAIERLPGDETRPAYRLAITPPADLANDSEVDVRFQFAEATIPVLAVPIVFE